MPLFSWDFLSMLAKTGDVRAALSRCVYEARGRFFPSIFAGPNQTLPGALLDDMDLFEERPARLSKRTVDSIIGAQHRTLGRLSPWVPATL